MIWTIVKKEIINNIITFRFTVGTVLFIGAIVFFMSVLIKDYEQKVENYNESVAKNNSEFRQLLTYQNLKPTVYKPPNVLSIFSRGVEESTGNSARVSIGDVPFAKGAVVSGENPYLSIFPAFDIVLIFKFIISLLVFLFAYDAVSGEKEDKTLGMMLANSIPRYQILLGKFTGGLITISITVLIGFLVGGIILTISPVIKLSVSDLFRIVLMFFISIVFIGVLYSLGLFISSITKSSSNTLILLLFLWILYVLVIPDLSIYIASNFKSVESREKIDSQVQEIWRDFDKKRRDFQKSNKLYTGGSEEPEPWGYYYIYAEKASILGQKEIHKNLESIRINYAERAWQVEKGYLESLRKQRSTSNILARFSPVSIYEILISGLAGSDVAGSDRFFEQAKEYRRQIIEYLYNIDAFSLIRYFSTVKDEDIEDLADFKIEDFPNLQEYLNKYFKMRDEYIREKPLPLNIENIPKFQFKYESTIETIKRILTDIALLSIMGIIFFLLAFVSFIKYDAR